MRDCKRLSDKRRTTGRTKVNVYGETQSVGCAFARTRCQRHTICYDRPPSIVVIVDTNWKPWPLDRISARLNAQNYVHKGHTGGSLSRHARRYADQTAKLPRRTFPAGNERREETPSGTQLKTSRAVTRIERPSERGYLAVFDIFVESITEISRPVYGQLHTRRSGISRSIGTSLRARGKTTTASIQPAQQQQLVRALKSRPLKLLKTAFPPLLSIAVNFQTIRLPLEEGEEGRQSEAKRGRL